MAPSDDRLTITTATDSGHVALTGELDAHTASQLDEALGTFDAAESLTLDLSGVTFLDSSGLRTIVAAHTTRCDAGGALTLAAPSPVVTKLLDITGLAEHLSIDGHG